MPLPDNMPSSIDRLYVDALTAEKEVLETSILRGACTDHSRYMWEAGQLQGLRIAEAHFKDLVRKWENS